MLIILLTVGWLLDATRQLLALYVALRLIRAYLTPNYKAFTSKAIVITGASSGFGRAIALRLFELGATVYAGCVDQDAVDEMQRAHESDPRWRPIKLDVTKDADVEAAVKVVSACLVDHPDLSSIAIINNAGISSFGWAEVLPLERHAMNVEVNYLGTVRVTRAFLPLVRQSRGRIVNIGSIGACMPSAFGSSYLPTKAAMRSYSECVRQEVHRHGVKVAYVEPGFFETSLLGRASVNGATHDSELHKLPEPEEAVARIAAYPSFVSKMASTTEQIRGMERLNGGADGAYAVVDAVVDAICNRFPLRRYTVGIDGFLIRYCLSWMLPDWLVDEIQTYA